MWQPLPPPSRWARPRPKPSVNGVIRVYNDNIENLVYNLPNQVKDKTGKVTTYLPCRDVSAKQHAASMFVDDAGKTVAQGGKPQAPDILTFQQVRGKDQTVAYAAQLTTYFANKDFTWIKVKPTYATAIVAWDDPESWGGHHDCNSDENLKPNTWLGDKKNKQTNAILYNTQTLKLDPVGSPIGTSTPYWSAGWSPDGGKSVSDCRLYKLGPHEDPKWKRTSAVAARFSVRANPAVVVWAASMHLPQENHQPVVHGTPDLKADNACGGDHNRGEIGSDGLGTGVHMGDEAHDLMVGSTIRVVGMDANRMNLQSDTLKRYNLVNVGSGNTHQATFGWEKIDYIFAKGPNQGSVAPSPIGNTVASTESPHKALYAFVSY